MAGRSWIGKHGAINDKRHGTTADPYDGELCGIGCSEVDQKHTCQHGAGYTQAEIYRHAEARAVEEPTSQTAGYDPEQNEDDD